MVIFVHGSDGFVNDGSLKTISFDFSFYQRNIVLDHPVSGVITSSQYAITEATTDNLWLSLDYSDLSTIEITISGYSEPANVIDTGDPQPNEIKLASATAGLLEFNIADDGKSIAGTVLYLKKFHETEILS